MNKKNILILFIISFVSVIYTINHICYVYIDEHLDNYIQKTHATSSYITKEKYETTKITPIKENKRLFICLIVSFVSIMVFVYTKQVPSIIYAIFFIIAYFSAYKLLLNQSISLNIISTYIAFAISLYFATVYKNIFKNNLNEKIEDMLSKYISQDIKNKILKSNLDVGLGGKRAEITVMFADIRGFTALSETRKAEEVSQLLNEYFSELEPIITKYNGVINKYIGDAVLVVFGDPEQDKLHAKNAVKCAYELRNKVKFIRQQWIEQGKPQIDIGIGINTGEAFIGNVGTKNRFEYTVIGDTVNIASRIDDYNKIYKTNLLISETTYNKISQIVDAIKIREVSIKGKQQKINIYEVLRITE